MMENLSEKSFGRYRLIERLGEGGMATVYKAYDSMLDREVAIKIIRPEGIPPEMLNDTLKRFEREAKALARLSHPNIVKVLDFGEHEGSPFLVLEYLAGGTLKQKVGTSMPWQEAVQLLLPIARGIEYAHRRGVIHRDIKPANILMTELNEPTLSDFGIAKIFGGEQTTNLTASGMAIGTPEYMAPEQWTGEPTTQSDIYAFGIVLYELITGRKPYVADTPGGILIKQVSEPLPLPRQYVSNLPGAVEAVLVKALSRNPKDRYEDMQALITALQDLLSQAVTEPVTPARSNQVEALVAAPQDDHAIIVPGDKADNIPQTHLVTGEQGTNNSQPSIKTPTRFSRRNILVSVAILAIVMLIAMALPSLQSMVVIPGLSNTATPTPTKPFTSIPSLTNTELPPGPTFTPTLTPTATLTPTPTQTPTVTQTPTITPLVISTIIIAPENVTQLAKASSWKLPSPVFAVDISGNDLWVAAGEKSGAISIYTVDGSVLQQYNYESIIYDLKFSPDSKWLVVAGESGKLMIINTQTWDTPLTIAAHGNALKDMAFSFDGKYLITGGLDNQVKIWNVESWDLYRAINANRRVYGLDASPVEDLIAVGMSDGHINLWDSSGNLVGDFDDINVPTASIVSLRFTPDGKLLGLASSDPSNAFQIWDVPTRKLKREFGEGLDARGITFSPDGQVIATYVDNDNILTFWRTTTAARLAFFDSYHQDVITAVAFSKDGTLLVTGSVDRTVWLWSVPK